MAKLTKKQKPWQSKIVAQKLYPQQADPGQETANCQV